MSAGQDAAREKKKVWHLLKPRVDRARRGSPVETRSFEAHARR
jgi:hypothetical protein